MNKSTQAALSFGIRLAAIGGVAILDYLSNVYTSFQLPQPGITVPLLGLFISEADTWLVNWTKENK